jgi:hypothetical protein
MCSYQKVLAAAANKKNDTGDPLGLYDAIGDWIREGQIYIGRKTIRWLFSDRSFPKLPEDMREDKEKLHVGLGHGSDKPSPEENVEGEAGLLEGMQKKKEQELDELIFLLAKGGNPGNVVEQLNVVGPDGVSQGRNRERKNAFSQQSPDALMPGMMQFTRDVGHEIDLLRYQVETVESLMEAQDVQLVKIKEATDMLRVRLKLVPIKYHVAPSCKVSVAVFCLSISLRRSCSISLRRSCSIADPVAFPIL